MNLRFTVITVVFNAGEAIRKTIESVLNQTYSPHEYLVIDGKSMDNTLDIVHSYNASFEQKGISFRVTSEKDTGIYNAMNKGIKLAQGDFISFLNAGDWYEPDALESIATFYSEGAFDLTYGGLNYYKPDGTITHKMSKLDRFPISSRHWNHPSMFLRTQIYRKYAFDEAFRVYADFNLYLKLRRDGTRIRVIDKVIANFVADGVSTDTNLKKVLGRAKEKYRAYRGNGYSRVYWIECYCWELAKTAYLRLHS